MKLDFLKRFEFWLILACCVVAFAIGISGCDGSKSDRPQREPEQSRVLQEYRIGGNTVFEFEDSLGRRCLYMRSGYSGLLSCDYPRDAAPLRYEDLPGAERVPEREPMPKPR